ncbi:hypothetical protein Q1695_012645 [Nippostrongylus brasiliensis]|nr:hypothetical protein Q1695_012645 [Nippostrongylus brasiliensis]
MIGFVEMSADCLLILSLLVLLNLIACNKSRPVRYLSESGEIRSRGVSLSQENLAVQRRGSDNSLSRDKHRRTSEVEKAANVGSRAVIRKQQPELIAKAPHPQVPFQPRRKRTARIPTIEADFEPGQDQADLLEAAEEMAKDAGGYENMDPNEGATNKAAVGVKK